MEFLSQLYSNYLYPTFIYLIRSFVNGWVGLCILIVALIILSILSKKIKVRILSPIITLASVVATIFLILALFFRLVFFIDDLAEYGKSLPDSSSSSSSTSTPSSNDSNSTENQTAPTTVPDQTTKQLYYSTSCSNCSSPVCNRNGYYYNGYDEQSWLYYKDLCQSCQCLDQKSQSFYK